MSKRVMIMLLSLLAVGLIGCQRPPKVEAVIRTSPEPPRGPYPLEVTFDASGSHGAPIDRYVWDFGLGPTGRHEGTSEGVQVRHTFQERGAYTVYLTVVDQSGRTAQASVRLDVRSKPPVAQFRIEGTVGGTAEVGQELTFDGSASHDPDGSVEEYRWDFGDGTTTVSEAPVVRHRYLQAGMFTVSLIVQDDNGDLSAPAVQQLPVYGGCPTQRLPH